MDYRQLYETRADRYQQLVAAEDVDGNLAAVLSDLLAGPLGDGRIDGPTDGPADGPADGPVDDPVGSGPLGGSLAGPADGPVDGPADGTVGGGSIDGPDDGTVDGTVGGGRIDGPTDRPVDGPVSVAEIGAGTGRVTRILVGLGHTVVATEPAAAMIEVAARLDNDGGAGSAGGAGNGRAFFCRAGAASLPVADGAVDAAVAGWVFGHQVEWAPASWRTVIGGFVDECVRVTGGGPIVIIETLGTGHEEPAPPTDLVAYYRWLEDLGFERRWIRTDYEFPSVEVAAAVAGDFFGDEFAETVTRNRWSRIPECTGIWWR